MTARLILLIITLGLIFVGLLLGPFMLYVLSRKLRGKTPEEVVMYLRERAGIKVFRDEPPEVFAKKQVRLMNLAHQFGYIMLIIASAVTFLCLLLLAIRGGHSLVKHLVVIGVIWFLYLDARVSIHFFCKPGVACAAYLKDLGYVQLADVPRTKV